MDRKQQDEQAWVGVPDWLKNVEDDDVASTIFALMFDWQMFGETKIDNLREYVEENFEELSDKQVEEVCNLLIEYKLVK